MTQNLDFLTPSESALRQKLFNDIVQMIQRSQQWFVVAMKSPIVFFYWSLGKEMKEKLLEKKLHAAIFYACQRHERSQWPKN